MSIRNADIYYKLLLLYIHHCTVSSLWLYFSLHLFLDIKGKATAADKEPNKAKAKPAEKEVAGKENEVSVSLLNIQVGLIRKAWKHPSADR